MTKEEMISKKYEQLRDMYEELSYRFLRLEKDNSYKHNEIVRLDNELRKYKILVPDYMINNIR